MQARLFLLLLKPSFLSTTVITLVTIIVIGGLNWPYFTYNPALYSFLYGEFGVITALEQSPEGIRQFQDAITSSPILYGVVVLLIALIAGRAAYSFVHGLKATGAFYAGTPAEKQDLLHRIMVRGLILTAWIIYGIISITMLFPFCILLSRIGAETITTANGIIMNIEAFLLFFIGLHIHVILARLFLMRPRVFGGRTVIDDVAFYHKQ